MENLLYFSFCNYITKNEKIKKLVKEILREEVIKIDYDKNRYLNGKYILFNLEKNYFKIIIEKIDKNNIVLKILGDINIYKLQDLENIFKVELKDFIKNNYDKILRQKEKLEKC